MPDARLPESVSVTLLVTEVLDRLSVPYLIGGSVASAVHGAFRSTLDTDLVVDLPVDRAGLLAEALTGSFYVDVEASSPRSWIEVISTSSTWRRCSELTSSSLEAVRSTSRS